MDKARSLDSIPLDQQEKFAPVCPDFVIELRSKSDSLIELKFKINQWIRNGCQHAWLIDPLEKKAYVYLPDQPEQEVTGFDQSLKGENLLPGFELDLARLN